ncbi:MAG: HAD family phosphatase [Erysipelotrichaceae bacterium]|nr:HAD family phosphatase [Erysipelotrichaceae bacterium]
MKNFIFDIGNVLVDFHPVTFFEKRMPDMQMDRVCTLVFDDVWEQIDCGVLTCEQAQSVHLRRYPHIRKQIVFIYDHWMEMMRLKDDTYAFFKQCKALGNAVYLLSNIGEESHRYLKHKYDFFDLADGMVLSYQERVLKPNPAIFRILLDRYCLDPSDCVFFDDRKENVETARLLGIQGIVFQSMAQAEVIVC